MAEIKIEKRKPVWPWLLAIIIIGVLIYFMFFNETDNDSADDYEVDDTIEQIDDTDTYPETTSDTITI